MTQWVMAGVCTPDNDNRGSVRQIDLSLVETTRTSHRSIPGMVVFDELKGNGSCVKITNPLFKGHDRRLNRPALGTTPFHRPTEESKCCTPLACGFWYRVLLKD